MSTEAFILQNQQTLMLALQNSIRGAATWAGLVGNVSDNTALQTALNAKQDALPNFTTGQILFGDGSNIPNSDSLLRWDNPTKRFTIGSSIGYGRLGVVGLGATSSTYSLAVHNISGSSNSLLVRDDGNVYMGATSGARKLNVESSSSYVAQFKTTSHATDWATMSIYSDSGGAGLLTSDLSGWYCSSSQMQLLLAGHGVGTVFYTTGDLKVGRDLEVVRDVAVRDGGRLIGTTTTGFKFMTSPAQKIGFWNAAPVARPAAVADATGGAVVDTEARAAINALLSRIRSIGLIAA